MHEKWMQRAIDNALKAWGHTSPNPHVGAVIVKDGEVIADGWHKKAGTHHAEKDAISKLREAGREEEMYGATIYVTLEPCCTYGRTEPCTEWIMEAGISKVVYGCTDTNPEHAGRGFNYLLQGGVDVVGPILEEECLYINRFFFKWINKQKPYVVLKMAQTLDGKIATENGHSQWITGPEARHEVQKLRVRVAMPSWWAAKHCARIIHHSMFEKSKILATPSASSGDAKNLMAISRPSIRKAVQNFAMLKAQKNGIPFLQT